MLADTYRDPYCDIASIARQIYLLAHNSVVFVLSPFVTLNRWNRDLQIIWLSLIQRSYYFDNFLCRSGLYVCLCSC